MTSPTEADVQPVLAVELGVRGVDARRGADLPLQRLACL
jgi:hypothetical protein